MGCRCRGGQNIPVHAFLTSWIYGPDKCHRSRHLPKTVQSTDNLKHTMLEARRVKEERRRKHTRVGDSKPKPGKSWLNKHRLLNVFYMFSCRLYEKAWLEFSALPLDLTFCPGIYILAERWVCDWCNAFELSYLLSDLWQNGARKTIINYASIMPVYIWLHNLHSYWWMTLRENKHLL